jgi:hypothetical protein
VALKIVEKAPRHEVAGGLAGAGQRAPWGFELRADLEVGAMLAQGDLDGCRIVPEPYYLPLTLTTTIAD